MSRAGAGENANYICFKTIQTVQPEHPSHETFYLYDLPPDLMK